MNFRKHVTVQNTVDMERRRYAKELKRLLEKYQHKETEAAMCLRELGPLIRGALDGSLKTPQDVPCGWHFHWGELRKYPGLEDAYCEFAERVCQDDSSRERTRKFFHQLDTDPKFDARMMSSKLTWWEHIWSWWERLKG